MIRCDEECPPTPWAGAAIVGAFATIAAAAVGPLLELRARAKQRERDAAERLAKLEALLAVQMAPDDEDEDE